MCWAWVSLLNGATRSDGPPQNSPLRVLGAWPPPGETPQSVHKLARGCSLWNDRGRMQVFRNRSSVVSHHNQQRRLLAQLARTRLRMVAAGLADCHDDDVTRQQLAGSKFGTASANEKEKLLMPRVLVVEWGWLAEHHEPFGRRFVRRHQQSL